jgi:hypothetical protein
MIKDIVLHLSADAKHEVAATRFRSPRFSARTVCLAPSAVAGWKLIEIKNGKRSPDSEKLSLPGRGLDLRSDMGGFDALFTTGERAHYRFAEGTSQGGMWWLNSAITMADSLSGYWSFDVLLYWRWRSNCLNNRARSELPSLGASTRCWRN